eukprot:365747-Chlamydomonas_euryale.AAC.3
MQLDLQKRDVCRLNRQQGRCDVWGVRRQHAAAAAAAAALAAQQQRQQARQRTTPLLAPRIPRQHARVRRRLGMHQQATRL